MESSKQNNVQINITTYKKDSFKADLRTMNEEKSKRNHRPNKLLCAICLNSKPQDKTNENNRNNSKSCPVCKKTFDIYIKKDQDKVEKIHIETEKVLKVKEIKSKNTPRDKVTQTKSVQTMPTDLSLNKNINLLNEVLTVFQSKKMEQKKSNIFKDANVSTSNIGKVNTKKLSLCKALVLSIDHNKVSENGKFVVMSSKFDDCRSKIDLINHKSSSIPQMKLEELKYSLKEKTKSKDVIEEVNRMFATVRKKNDDGNVNRPSLRSGPRVLPVVETNHNEKTQLKQSCCCQANCMSSGDSIKCCHRENERDEILCCDKRDMERCEKCVYMLCCHYKNCRKMKGVMICERCRDLKEVPSKYSQCSFEDSF